MAKQIQNKPPISLRPAIVAVLGHVDHGKTTLLDAIRNTDIASKEFGGITQHIGAYQIEVASAIVQKQKSKVSKITFIDTPGHEAFAKMRSRGVNAADIAILVVAGNDGVMPQTIESINHIKAAGIHCIVAINKIDLPDVNFEKVKKQLVKNGLNLEEYGGDIPVVPVSAKTKQGLDKLLETILFLSDLYEIREGTPGKLKAIVIESVLSKNRGPVASIVLQSGNLSTGDEVVCRDQEFRVRALFNWRGEGLREAKAGDPVELLGWKTVPAVGSLLLRKMDIELTKPALNTLAVAPEETLATTPKILPPEQETVKLILKADTSGTLEAIKLGLGNKIILLSSGIGDVTESDILLAKTVNALVVSFNTKVNDQVAKLAETEKVIIKTYHIIYELFDEIDEVVEAIRTGNLVKTLGESKIIAVFHIKDQTIAGIKVVTGRIARGDQVKVLRGDQELGRAKIKSLRHGKEDVTKVEQGQEAGVLLSQKVDYLTGDSIISIG